MQKIAELSTGICSWLILLPENLPPLKCLVHSLLVKRNKNSAAYKYLKQSVRLVF